MSGEYTIAIRLNDYDRKVFVDELKDMLNMSVYASRMTHVTAAERAQFEHAQSVIKSVILQVRK